MEVSFLGKNSFKIKTKSLTLITDPVNSKEKADVVVYTGVTGTVRGLSPVNLDKTFVIDLEGEYELGGVGVVVDRLSSDEEGKLVRITADGVGIANVVALSTNLDDKTKEKLSEADLLIVPLGLGKLIGEAEPYIAILSGYDNTQQVDQFLTTNKFEVVKRDIDKLKLDDASLPESTEVVVLNG